MIGVLNVLLREGGELAVEEGAGAPARVCSWALTGRHLAPCAYSKHGHKVHSLLIKLLS
jgi:hypothetical protein